MIRQESLNGAAQKRGVMAGHGRNDEEPRLRAAGAMLESALEMQEPAERPLPDWRDMHRHMLAADHGQGDVPLRPAVAAGRALKQLGRGSDRLAKTGMSERIGRVAAQRGWDAGELVRREKLQMPLDKKREMSDHVVVNTAKVDDVRSQIREVFSRIVADLPPRPARA